MTKKTTTPTWSELLAREPKGILDVFAYVAGQDPNGMQILLRLQREGHPNLLLGVEDETYEPEDFEAVGRGGVALIAVEYARALRENEPDSEEAVTELPEDVDARLKSLARVGAHLARQMDELIALKGGVAHE